jgi:peptidoglycan/LPS O-acetylase OafA/YrhL
MRIKVLDYLRIVSVLSVFIFHYSVFENPFQKFNSHIPFFRENISGYGFLGVDVFFILSGIVIVRTSRARTPKEFFQARFLRLAPALAIVLPSLFLMETLSNKTIMGPDFIPSLNGIFMLNYVFGQSPLDTVLWSLWVEVRFYILFGIALIYLRSHRSYVIFFWALNLVVLFQSFMPSLVSGIIPPLFLPYFLFGGILGFINSKSELLRVLPLLAFELILVLNSVKIRILQTKPQISWNGDLNVNYGVLFMAFIGIWLFISVLKFHTSIPSKGHKYIELLGKSTYFFYLTHLTFAGSMTNLLVSWLKVQGNSLLPFLLMFLLLTALSIFFVRFVEGPLTKLLKNWIFPEMTK